jgi:hypothetical protein
MDSNLAFLMAAAAKKKAEANALPDVSSIDNGKVLGVVDGEWGLAEDAGAVLPDVTQADDGDVLGVVSGTWSKMNVDTLPAVTGADNGKALGVVGGAWSAVAADLGLTKNLQNAFSTSLTYAVGDIVVYSSKLYRCTTAVTTAGAWTGTTNWTEIQLDDLQGMTNPMSAAGDLIVGGASGAAGRLAKGTAGQVLTMNSGATAPEWQTPSAGMTNPMTTQGDIIVGGTSGAATRLAKGAEGRVLTAGSSSPAWTYLPCFTSNPVSDPQVPNGQIAICLVSSEPAQASQWTNVAYFITGSNS